MHDAREIISGHAATERVGNGATERIPEIVEGVGLLLDRWLMRHAAATPSHAEQQRDDPTSAWAAANPSCASPTFASRLLLCCSTRRGSERNRRRRPDLHT